MTFRHNSEPQMLFPYGVFSVRSPKKRAKCHHPDWDFNETQYTGLFHPKNKLVNVKISNFENFSKYGPPNSDQIFSILAIIFFLIIKKLHMYSDITSENYAFLWLHPFFISADQKNFKHLNPPPLGHFNFFF